jgi:hypothetical protein
VARHANPPEGSPPSLRRFGRHPLLSFPLGDPRRSGCCEPPTCATPGLSAASPARWLAAVGRGGRPRRRCWTARAVRRRDPLGHVGRPAWLPPALYSASAPTCRSWGGATRPRSAWPATRRPVANAVHRWADAGADTVVLQPIASDRGGGGTRMRRPQRSARSCCSFYGASMLASLSCSRVGSRWPSTSKPVHTPDRDRRRGAHPRPPRVLRPNPLPRCGGPAIGGFCAPTRSVLLGARLGRSGRGVAAIPSAQFAEHNREALSRC